MRLDWNGPAGRLLLIAIVVVTLSTAAAAQPITFTSGPADWYSPAATEHQAVCCGEVDCSPHMIGDTAVGLLTLRADDDAGAGAATVPFPGGSDRMMVSRNNSALLRSRVYTLFDHAAGAFSLTSQPPAGAPTSTTANLDRLVVGAERVIWNDRLSLEIRLPISSDRAYSFDRLSLQSDSVIGNIGLITKVQLAKTSSYAVAAGVASQIPTGQSISGQYGGASFQVDHDAYYVSPFLAITGAPSEDWFYNGFAQIDFTLEENTVTAFGQSRDYSDQTLLRLSAGGGRWFFRKDHGLLRGMAGIGELHYTATLDDSDAVTLLGTGQAVTLGSTGNSSDVLNLTSGLHIEFKGGSNARVAASVPLRNSQRFHDATLMVQFNIPL